MALEKTVEKVVLGESLTFTNAYHQITSLTGNKDEVLLQLTTHKNVDKEIVLDVQTYSFTPDDSEDALRWDKQGYEYLKTLDEYADAIGV